MNQTNQRTLSNVCLFCNDVLPNPKMCKFCGFKFCNEHMSTDSHQCIKTRYIEYIKKTDKMPNVAHGTFRVVCNVCGYVSKKGTPIEYAGEELTQHMQLIGCTGNIFLEELFEDDIEQVPATNPVESKPHPMPVENNADAENNETSIVEQIIKLSSFKEKGMISDDEFLFIKKELIKKLQK